MPNDKQEKKLRKLPFQKMIFVFFDDLGYGDLSCNNHQPVFETQHIDQLAREGLRFTDAHATSAVCTPSRYSLLAGRYNWRSRLKRDVLDGYAKPLLEAGRRTIGNLFQDFGWRTACIGKWHLGLEFFGQEERTLDPNKALLDTPLDHGFDEFFGISASLDMPPYVYIRNKKWTSAPDRITKNNGMGFWREGPTGADFKHEQVLDKLIEEACLFIENHQAENFFLYLPLPAPHTPILPLDSFKGMSGLNAYTDFVLQCDAAVGTLRATLENLELSNETCFIVSSDNGCSPQADFPALEAQGHYPSDIYRGMKSDLYEGGHRIPLIVSCPGLIPAGAVEENTVSLVDLYASCAKVLGYELKQDEAEDSFAWPYANDKPRPPILAQSIHGELCLREGDYKLLASPGSGGWSEASDPNSEETLQLYDLATDPHEDRNLVREMPKTTQALLQKMAKAVYDGATRPEAIPGEQAEPIPWPAIESWYKDKTSR